MEEYEYDVIIYGTGLINCLIGSILTKNNIKILHIDKYSDYGNQFRSLNFKQFLLHNYSNTVLATTGTVVPGTNEDNTTTNNTSLNSTTNTTNTTTTNNTAVPGTHGSTVGPITVTEENSNTEIAAPKVLTSPLGTNSNITTTNEIAVVTKTGESGTFTEDTNIEEKNPNEIAVVTNFGESDTFSEGEGKGANSTAMECTTTNSTKDSNTKEIPFGTVGIGCRGPDPVTEDLVKKILPYKKINNEERKKILKEILLENNKYNIDIYPKFFIKNSFFSKFLIETNLHNNLQFCTNHNNNIFFISNSSVTVTGPTENTEEPNNITEENSNTQIAAKGSTGIKDSKDITTIRPSTVTEEKNTNKVAAVTKTGESGTFSNTKDIKDGEEVGTEGDTKGVGEDTGAVGASTVTDIMEELVYDKNSIFRCKYLNLIEKRLLYKFFNHISSVTVLGPTSTNGPEDSTNTNNLTTTPGKVANSTLMECTTEENSNEIAAVTKTGESSTFSEDSKDTNTKGDTTVNTTKDTSTVGASTVTDTVMESWNEYLKKNNLNKKLIKIINNCILINNKNNINENIKEIKNYLKIFEKDKNFLIYFLYGISNLIQNISRLSSIYNCHFMLNQYINSVTVTGPTDSNRPEVTTDNLSTSNTEDIPGKGANSMGMECTSEKITNEIAAVTKTRESTNNSKDTNTKVTMDTNETPFGVGGTGSRDTDPVTEKRIEIILDDYKIYTKYIISEYDITNNITPVTESDPSDSNPTPKGANTGYGSMGNSTGIEEAPIGAVGVTEETGAVGASTVTEEEKIIIVYIISNKKLLNDFNLCIILSDDDSSVTVTGPTGTVTEVTSTNSTTASGSDTIGTPNTSTTKDIKDTSFSEENSTTQFAADGKGDSGPGCREPDTVMEDTVMENIYIIQLNKETYNSPENKYIIYFITKYKENILNKILKLYNNLGNDLNTILYYTFNLFNIFNYIHIFSTNTVLAPMATTAVPDTNNTTNSTTNSTNTNNTTNITTNSTNTNNTKESSFGGGTKDIGAVELDTLTEINGINIYKYKYKNNIILLTNELNISYYISQIFLSIYYSNTVTGPTNSTTISTLTTTNGTTGASTVTEGKGANSTAMECTMGKGANSMGTECTTTEAPLGASTEETSNINNIKGTPLGVKGGTFGVKEVPFWAGDAVGCRGTDPVTEEKLIENYLKYKNIDEENIDINCEFLNDLINKFIF
uniref:GDP dissociation inhibitor, putative n=1 Tax=Theileria annulata TaxID=5874 RepID=A0A3B0NIX2_THEAN